LCEPAATSLDRPPASPRKCHVILSRVAKAVCALASILVLAGVSILPLEHIHGHSDDATQHPAVVHRHFAAHHGSGVPGLRLPALQRLGGDRDDHGDTIQVFFTAGTRVEPHRTACVAVGSDADVHAVPALVESGRPWLRPWRVYTSPPDTPPALRGPPAFS
jgi:hypothetical protein